MTTVVLVRSIHILVQWGCDFNNAHISIDEVDSDDYNATNVKEIVYSEDLRIL